MDTESNEFPFSFPGQLHDDIARECGACDSSGYSLSFALQARRIATGAFRFTNAAGVLTASENQVVTLFSKGVGESGADAQIDGNLTAADTDALSEGALVTGAADHFIVRAISVSLGAPYVSGGGTERQNREWMKHYTPDMQRRVMEDFAMSIEHGEGAQPYQLGPLAMYPSQSGPASAGDFFQQIGSPFAGAVIPLRAVLKGGAKATASRLRVKLSATRRSVIAARAAPNAADVDTVLPVRVELLGFVRYGAQPNSSVAAHGPGLAALSATVEKQGKALEQAMTVLERLADRFGKAPV